MKEKGEGVGYCIFRRDIPDDYVIFMDRYTPPAPDSWDWIGTSEGENETAACINFVREGKSRQSGVLSAISPSLFPVWMSP